MVDAITPLMVLEGDLGRMRCSLWDVDDVLALALLLALSVTAASLLWCLPDSLWYANLVRTKSKGYVIITAEAPAADPASKSMTGETGLLELACVTRLTSAFL